MGKTLRVLIVEDSEEDALLLVDELRQGGYEPIFERVDTAKAVNEALHRQIWDVVIADYVMPSFTGRAALEQVKAKGDDIPFIIVSGKVGEEVAVETMKAGAHDYVMKNNLSRLVPAVKRELEDVEVRRERRHFEEERNHLMGQLRKVNEQLIVSSVRIQEQADEASRKAAELDAILLTVAEGLVVYNLKGDIVRMNPIAADLLGYSPEEQEKSIAERGSLLRAETSEGKPFPANRLPAARALRGEVVRGVVMVLHQRPDAKPVWVSVSAAPIKTADGEPGGAVAFFADVTALRGQNEG